MNYTEPDYTLEAKASWGQTPEWKEYEQKSRGRTKDQEQDIARGMMDIFAEFGAIRDTDPAAEPAQALVNKLQGYITEHFYTCSDGILLQLSRIYVEVESMKNSIDKVGGPGTAAFVQAAVETKCRANPA